jgi:cytochrome c biogenesis protein CcmG/thiol:disulfide interchange protein DsbE
VVVLAVGAVVVALGVVLALTVSSDPQAETRSTHLIGKDAPDVTVRTLDGKPVRLGDYRGKTVVVNFWNTWCIPCRQELPALKQWYAQRRADPDVILVGIVRDDTEAAVRRSVLDDGIAWTVATDPGGDAALEFGTRGQPETFVIGPLGKVRAAQIQPVSVKSLDLMVANAQAAG